MAEAVKVIVRCRPLNSRENTMKCNTVVQMDSSIGQCGLFKPKASEPPKSFTFDGAYYVDSTTEQIYSEICFPLVDGVLEGYNGTVFAYGQTGCGKSFSMMGIPDPPTQRGIIPRAFEHIFECIQVADETKYLVHASYLEIYNEEIRDLLGHDHKQKHELKEHPERGVYVKDLSMHPVNSVKEMEHVMELGNKNRSVGSTLMNADSSRSHSIFTINIEMIGTGDDGGEHIRAGKLNLVDLAGSERQAKTGATGDRLKEATKINLSLSALGNVISALVDGKSKHIPYRDSKLTRLLQDSLGGNTKTLMVACLSPADNNYDETLSTLRYANRAKNIKNKPKINEDPKDALLREYKEEIEKLKAMLMGQMPKEMLGSSGASQAHSKPKHVLTKAESVAVEEAEEIKHEYEQKLADMKNMYEQEQLSKQKLQDEMNQLKQIYEGKIHVIEEKTGGDIPGFSGLLESNDGSSEPSTPAHHNQGGYVMGSQLSVIGLDSVQGSAGHLPMSNGDAATSSFNGFSPPPSSPTGGSGNTIAANAEMQVAALKRLQELQEKMVGGERKNDTKLKDKRKQKKAVALSRKEKLVKAIQKMGDGDQVMVKVYDNLQDEIKAKNKTVSELESKLKSSENEIDDLQYEFERDREDYLETIRKQEQMIKLQQQILNRIQPCIRRDCNYYNIDKIKAECVWNEEESSWVLPELVVTRTTLPTPGVMPGANVQRGGALLPGRRSPNMHTNTNRHAPPPEPEMNGYFHEEPDEDRYLKHLNRNAKEDITQSYFAPKRANRLLSETNHSFKQVHTSHNLPNFDRRSSQNNPFEANANPMGLGLRPARLESLNMHNVEKESKKKKKSHRMLHHP